MTSALVEVGQLVGVAVSMDCLNLALVDVQVVSRDWLAVFANQDAWAAVEPDSSLNQLAWVVGGNRWPDDVEQEVGDSFAANKKSLGCTGSSARRLPTS